MGNSDSKLNFRKAVIQLTTKTQVNEHARQTVVDAINFRKAVIQLTTKTQPVEATDDAFWDQFWADTTTSVQDVFALVPAAEIRAVREESPSNLATLCYKAVEKLVQATESGCPSQKEKQIVLNCTRLLTRILPYIFEDADWRGFFWSTVPGVGRAGADEGDDDCGRPLAESLLLAIADLLFCPEFTVQSHKKGSLDTAEDIHSIDSCEYIWEAGVGFAHSPPLNYIHDLNRWVKQLLSALERVLVEHAGQVLIVMLEHEGGTAAGSPTLDGTTTTTAMDDQDPVGPDNLFVNYLSRIHREEFQVLSSVPAAKLYFNHPQDFQFILKGVARLLTNPLIQTYLPNSTNKIQFHQELLVLFWKLCDFNKKFLFFVLKSSDVLDILVPILFYLNDARADQSRVGLMHIGVFILLLLSGERNFGVRLNKPYSVRVPMDVPVFTGTHADLLIIIFHKIITSGHQRLQPLFDCLLTIVVNGNSNLVYSIIRKRNVFHQLANLPTDPSSIQKALQRKKKSPEPISRTNSQEGVSMEGSRPAAPAELGTLKISLIAMPGIDKLTEKSQVSEDGTMISVQPTDSNQSPSDSSGAAGASDTESNAGAVDDEVFYVKPERRRLSSTSSVSQWTPTSDWVLSWKCKLPLQTIMRLLQVLVPQVEKICNCHVVPHLHVGSHIPAQCGPPDLVRYRREAL
ncbi:UNVERIFIED_CONTAM: hypothetical protein FKN15_059883 [Acipenser sinensis]